MASLFQSSNQLNRQTRASLCRPVDNRKALPSPSISSPIPAFKTLFRSLRCRRTRTSARASPAKMVAPKATTLQEVRSLTLVALLFFLARIRICAAEKLRRIFSILARLRRRKFIASLRTEGVVTNNEAIVTALKETLRYGLFLGTFAGAFISGDEIIGSLAGHRRTAKWRALVAGAIAGPSMLLTGLNTQHTSLAIYILMHAAVLASRWHLSVYILKRESLLPSCKSFLNKHGGRDTVILQGVKEIASGTPFTNLGAIEEHYKSIGTNIKLDPGMEVPCLIVHGDQSCSGHIFSFLIQAYKRAFPV